MNLAEILHLDQFAPNVSAPDRWRVIDTLIDLLVRLGKIRPEDRPVVVKAVKDRETSNGTGIGYGLAIPHASVACLTAPLAVVARLNPPVDFQALDDQPVNLCVLLLTPAGQAQKHLQTLSAFARFLNNKTRRDQLANARTREEMLAVFQTAA
ncbi:MAG: PTS system fructose-specific EIIABC component [Verrucomicrobiae bacterium]|nr:PTS system fructose-specific EIIABC component [Verrucomicrobiae bacterium]